MEAYKNTLIYLMEITMNWLINLLGLGESLLSKLIGMLVRRGITIAVKYLALLNLAPELLASIEHNLVALGAILVSELPGILLSTVEKLKKSQ